MTSKRTENERQPPADLSHLTHRRIIGVLGILLPLLLWVLAGVRPTEGLSPWSLLDSVSAYYYTGAVAVFVGVLFALSLFLFSYPGYEGYVADRVVGCFGGVGALGIGLFPTKAPQGVGEPDWWSPWMNTAHYVSAVVLFSSFITFSIWLFRKSKIPKRSDRPPDKRWRDDICLVCGLVMVAAIAAVFVAARMGASIFWPETIAILAFAVCWLAKGELNRPISSLIHRFLRETP